MGIINVKTLVGYHNKYLNILKKKIYKQFYNTTTYFRNIFVPWDSPISI